MTPILALIVCTPAVLAPRWSELSFAPEKHLVLEKTIRGRGEFEFEDWTVLMNGQPVPSQYLPTLEVIASDVAEFVVRDEYLASAEGAPTKLRREFVSATASRVEKVSVNGESEGGERAGSCELEGCVVLLDETGDGPRRTLEHGECATETLDALEIDLDLTALLPRAGEADEWKREAGALNLMDDGWGRVECAFEPMEHDSARDPAQLVKSFDGTWQVVRGDTREVGGRRVLALALSGKFTSSCTVDGELRNVPVASGPTKETTSFELEAEGELLWDLDKHVLHSLEVEARGFMHNQTATTANGASGEPVYSHDMKFRGALTLALATKISK